MLACDTDIIGTRSMHTPSNILYTCYHIKKYMFRPVSFVEEEIYLSMYTTVGKSEAHGI